jgi:hypothetical protein
MKELLKKVVLNDDNTLNCAAVLRNGESSKKIRGKM